MLWCAVGESMLLAATMGLDLSAFEQSDGIYLISSPRQFSGGEEAYDEHVGDIYREDRLHSGRGAWRLIAHHVTRPVETILELGAGGGACSIGLVAAAEGVQMIVTDSSPKFLQMNRHKIMDAGLSVHDTRFATLAGEDLARLPGDSIDAIVIASALHHVGDWRRMLVDAAAVLRPGGVLVVQEPCREGNLMMAMALDVVLSPLWPQDLLHKADIDRIAGCRDSIYFLADSTIQKEGEDKHSFLVTELMAGGDAARFANMAFYSNVHFSDLMGRDLANRQAACSFVEYFDSFLEMHHRVSSQGMQALREHLFPLLQRIDARFRAGDGAALLGCMVFRR